MKQSTSPLKLLWNFAYSVQSKILFVLLLAVTFLEFIQVILRYVLHSPLFGIEELLLFPTIWLYLLGGANASWEKSHITCGVLSLYIKRPRSVALFNTVKGIVSITVCGWLAYWAFAYFQYSFKVWKLSATLYIPLVLGESALFIGLFLMTIYTAVELKDDLKVFLSTFGHSGSE
ncbi:MAG: TRAP transporter small permease [Synergistales bacterium]|nr:TRAP transporter small permease [Synergistales bacterium]